MPGLIREVAMTQPTTPPPGDPAPNPTTPPPAPTPTSPPDSPKPEDKPLGPGGEKALVAEREARKALEQKLKALAPLEQLAAMLGGQPSGDGKTDLDRLTDRVQQYETDLAAERQARWRAEIAAEAGLPPGLAARLQGGTREEMAADAAALKELIPAAAPSGPRTPAPDPSQGARGATPPDLDAEIAEAQRKGDWRTVIALQNQKLANTTK